MKRSIDETADRFDEMSETYDESRGPGAVETAERVVERAVADATGAETVVDIGAGTGALALNIAPHVDHVYALDISEGMRERAAAKAAEGDIDNVDFAHGTFRDPDATIDLPDGVDLVVSNFAMHHLSDGEKAEAIGVIRKLLGTSGRFVLGDVIVVDEADVSVEYYDPAVDDPATRERLVDLFEAEGFTVEFERTGAMAGVVDGRL